MPREDRAAGKANFTDVYNQPDPRAYFRRLGQWDYEIPAHGERVFSALLGARHKLAGREREEPPTVVDVCCSYGVNAALLKCDLTLDDLYDHYGDEALDDLSPEDVVEIDRDFYRRHRRASTQAGVPKVVGIDVSEHAIAYATKAGLLDSGWALNLEDHAPPPEFREAVAGTDLVTVTGGVGYVTSRTFERVLDAIEGKPQPWVAAFVLRMYDYDEFVDALARYGLVTEELAGRTFPQRRFASQEERDFALERLAARGVDPAGREGEGVYHTTFFLSRPPEDADAWPLDELLASTPTDDVD